MIDSINWPVVLLLLPAVIFFLVVLVWWPYQDWKRTRAYKQYIRRVKTGDYIASPRRSGGVDGDDVATAAGIAAGIDAATGGGLSDFIGGGSDFWPKGSSMGGSMKGGSMGGSMKGGGMGPGASP